MDPPTTPQMQVSSISSSSVRLQWDKIADEHNPIDGYTLYQRYHSKDSTNDEWKEINLKGHQSSYAALNLLCGTRHQFYLVAHNKAGKGKPSEVLTVRTDGSAPVAPSHQSIISSNTSMAIVHLNAWHDGGCTIMEYSVRYKMKSRDDPDNWHEVTIDNSNKPSDVEISNLIAGKKYILQVSATNQVGTTNADYTFSTFNEIQHEMGIRSSVYNSEIGRSSNRPFSSSISLQLTDYSILISVLASILVIVIISFLLCSLYRRLQFAQASSSSTHHPHQNGRHASESLYSSMTGTVLASVNNDGKSPSQSNSNTLRLQDFTKCMRNGENGIMNTETLPKVNCDTLSRTKYICSDLHSLGRSSEIEPLYATVKRTPRSTRSDTHIYNYPLIPSSMATVASSIVSNNNHNNNDISISSAATSDTFNGILTMNGNSSSCNCGSEHQELETKIIDHGLCPLLLGSP